MKAAILDHESLSPSDLNMEVLWSQPFQWFKYPQTSPEETSQRLMGVEVVLTNKVVISAEHLQQNPQIKLIVVTATGTNNVDLQSAAECGVQVCNVVDYSTNSVVQHTFALILALATRLPEYSRDVSNGCWQNSPFFGLLSHQIQELSGKKLGIVGYGAIGRGVASVARAFGMEVMLAESFRGALNDGVPRYPLNELLAQVDVTSIHCPLSERTQGLIAEKELAMMKAGSWLINVSRGGIVDEAALAAALKSRHIAGAGVDVLAVEPPGSGSMLLDPAIPNLILTPHSAWGSQQARQNLVGQLAVILSGYLKGDIINSVIDSP